MKCMQLIKLFIKSHGVDYMVGIHVSEYAFVAAGIFFGAFFMVLEAVFYRVNILLMFAAFVAGCIFPCMVLIISNNSDNDMMLTDIKSIFEMLKIQIHAGIYIVDALENCIEKVGNRRLKMSLNKLINDIYMSKNMEEALSDFNECFENKHIDILVVILKQSLETGYSVKNLDSAFEQMLDVEKAINLKMENSVERNVQVLQVLFMTGIIAISIYCSIIEFKGLFEGF